jgi:hypothetical protein
MTRSRSARVPSRCETTARGTFHDDVSVPTRMSEKRRRKRPFPQRFAAPHAHNAARNTDQGRDVDPQSVHQSRQRLSHGMTGLFLRRGSPIARASPNALFATSCVATCMAGARRAIDVSCVMPRPRCLGARNPRCESRLCPPGSGCACHRTLLRAWCGAPATPDAHGRSSDIKDRAQAAPNDAALRHAVWRVNYQPDGRNPAGAVGFNEDATHPEGRG